MRIDRRLPSNPTPLRPRRQFKLPLGGFRFWLTLSAIGILGSLIVLAAHVVLFAPALRLPRRPRSSHKYYSPGADAGEFSARHKRDVFASCPGRVIRLGMGRP